MAQAYCVTIVERLHRFHTALMLPNKRVHSLCQSLCLLTTDAGLCHRDVKLQRHDNSHLVFQIMIIILPDDRQQTWLLAYIVEKLGLMLTGRHYVHICSICSTTDTFIWNNNRERMKLNTNNYVELLTLRSYTIASILINWFALALPPVHQLYKSFLKINFVGRTHPKIRYRID